MIRPVVAPIAAAADAAPDLAALRDRLAGLLGAMDVDAFAELLARGSFAARITGMAGAPE